MRSLFSIITTAAVTLSVFGCTTVTDDRDLTPGNVSDVSTRAGVHAELVEVSAWENRMPTVGERPAGWPPRHLTSRLLLSNNTDREKTVTIESVQLSFDRSSFGRSKSGVTIANASGEASGSRRITLAPNTRAREVMLRGRDVFETGHQGETIYITVTLNVSNGEESTITLRQSGTVIAAM